MLASWYGRVWENRWSKENFSIGWRQSDVDPILVETVGNKWLRAGCSILDVGCGDGFHSAWLGSQGFNVVGIDFAKSAIKIANKQYAEPNTTFEVCDISLRSPSISGFDVILDRGCFHQIKPLQRQRMVANILNVINDGAKMILMAKIFQNPTDNFKSVSEQRKIDIISSVQDYWGPHFKIVDRRIYYFDPKAKRLPGFVFFMQSLSNKESAER